MVCFSYSSVVALALSTLTMGTVEAHSSLRTTSNGMDRKLEVDSDYGFVVSHIREDKDWCLTAAYGASEFIKLGFRKCNYEGQPANQLFKFDGDGKLHSALDDSKCMVLNHGDALFDGVKVRLADCNLPTLLNKFSLEGEEDYMKLALPFAISPEYCITNRGPNPHNGDTVLAKPCKDRGDFKWTFKLVTCNELILNGGFEEGFSSWSVDNFGSCTAVLNDGSVNLDEGSPTPPIDGSFDLLTLQNGPGRCTVKQSVTLPSDIVSATLSWKDRIRNHFDEFVDPTQESRVSVDVDGLGGMPPIEVWSTNPGDPLQQVGPNVRSFDVTPILQGLSGTVDIRFVEEDNFYYFNMNWDDVSLFVCSKIQFP